MKLPTAPRVRGGRVELLGVLFRQVQRRPRHRFTLHHFSIEQLLTLDRMGGGRWVHFYVNKLTILWDIILWV